jgi:hypothetical protein
MNTHMIIFYTGIWILLHMNKSLLVYARKKRGQRCRHSC